MVCCASGNVLLLSYCSKTTELRLLSQAAASKKIHSNLRVHSIHSEKVQGKLSKLDKTALSF